MKVLLACTALLACIAGNAIATTLQEVRAHKILACGVVTEAQDWTKEDVHGDLSALGTEICRAIAIAVLGDASAAKILRFPAEAEALQALHAQKADAIIGVTPSATRAVQYQVQFGPTIFWDTQTFMVHKALGITSAAGLVGQTVCYIDGTEAGAILLSSMQDRGIEILPFPFQEEGEMDAGLIGGHCRAISGSASRLAETRADFHAMVHDFVLLPDILAITPAAVATRQDDAAWTTIVATTLDVLVQAEMQGITRNTASHQQATQNPLLQHLLGADWSAALALSLAHDFSARIVATLGNYGEIFERTVGRQAMRGLDRGLNAVCTQGGALCAGPIN